jgi:hypothetical protein
LCWGSVGDVTYRDVFVEFLGDEELFARCCLAARVGEPGPHDLSEGERLAVWIYSCVNTAWSSRINRALWDGDADDGIKGVETILNAALQKLEPYVGPVYRSFRETDLDDLVTEYEVGASVHWFEFASATTDAPSALAGNVLFLVTPRTGRLLGPYSERPEDGEVVFPSGSHFKVCALERQCDSAVIELEEIVA